MDSPVLTLRRSQGSIPASPEQSPSFFNLLSDNNLSLHGQFKVHLDHYDLAPIWLRSSRGALRPAEGARSPLNPPPSPLLQPRTPQANCGTHLIHLIASFLLLIGAHLNKMNNFTLWGEHEVYSTAYIGTQTLPTTCSCPVCLLNLFTAASACRSIEVSLCTCDHLHYTVSRIVQIWQYGG